MQIWTFLMIFTIFFEEMRNFIGRGGQVSFLSQKGGKIIPYRIFLIQNPVSDNRGFETEFARSPSITSMSLFPSTIYKTTVIYGQIPPLQSKNKHQEGGKKTKEEHKAAKRIHKLGGMGWGI